MPQWKNRAIDVTKLFLLFCFLYISYAYIYETFGSPFQRFSYFAGTPSNTSKNIEDELEHALASTSTPNKTLIITVINKAYVETNEDASTTKSMLDLFLDSFWLGGNETRRLLNHVLFVTADQISYEHCMFRRLSCYRLNVSDGYFAHEEVFMSRDFVEMMWRRTLFLLNTLKRGYNFIFTDTDVVWLRDPFLRLSTDSSEDLQISTDEFRGDEWSRTNIINTGFYYIKSNNNTIALFERWYGMKNTSHGHKEQDVLQDLLGNRTETPWLNVRYLDTLYFSGFCERSKDIRKVVTVHANCCKGIRAKITDLSAVHRDWNEFKRFGIRNQTTLNVTANVTQPVVTTRGFLDWTPSWACVNSWRT